MTALARLQEEDPILTVERRAETHQTVMSGLGEAHLNVVMERMKRKFGVEVDQLPLRIPYRETIKGTSRYESRYIKQSGGKGQYAVATLEVEAQPEGAGYEFVNKISGGAIPQNFIPSVDKGHPGRAEEGVLAGYPVIDVKATLVDGKYHTVDSSDMAFQICASIGFKEACKARRAHAARAVGGRRDPRPRGDARRHHGRHQLQARTRPRHRAGPARLPEGERAGAGRGDGALRDRPALASPGAAGRSR